MAKTISLCCIAKNEAHNLPKFYESFAGCCDEYILVDTGSTDDTVEIAKKLGFKVYHFEWISDFAAARNYSFSHATCDYILWSDLDDILVNKEQFKLWKETAMELAPVHYIRYDYAQDKDGKSVCEFMRERVVRRDLNLKWVAPVHEGILTKDADGKWVPGQMCSTWNIKHVRTEAEMKADFGRNLKILEDRYPNLDPRLIFYYGKELFDSGQKEKASHILSDAVSRPELEPHDRILGLQYLAWALFELDKTPECLKVSLTGLQLDPTRAELLCIIADCHLKRGNLIEAIPYYQAAIDCPNRGSGGFSPAFSAHQCYGNYPRTMLARIKMQMGDFKAARKLLEEVPSPEAQLLLIDCEKMIQASVPAVKRKEVPDIVITCPPIGAYEFDEMIYREKGVGGSETALVEMAMHLKALTGRPVKVFGPRSEKRLAPSGVEYLPIALLQTYFQEYRPRIHIAWRHATRLTDSYSVVWCHDIVTPGGEFQENYEEMVCLSPFHAKYVRAMQGVDERKIFVSRNGIDPERFKNQVAVKEYARVIHSSSPDRGLVHILKIMDLVKEEIPEATLHAFYGFDNMKKYGLADHAELLERMIKERPWVTMHGNVRQDVLRDEFLKSDVWLYMSEHVTGPFCETSCITAMEALLTKTYPVVRKIGALKDTLFDADERGMCDLHDIDPRGYRKWADITIAAIKEKRWQNMSFNPDKYSWLSIAREWQQRYSL